MSVLVWIVIGGLAGWIASMIMDADGNLPRNITVGIVGALIGGFIMSAAGATGVTDFNVWSFLVALMGSIVLLGILRFVTKRSAH